MFGLCGQISSTKCSNVWVSNAPICFAACCEGGRFARCEFHGVRARYASVGWLFFINFVACECGACVLVSGRLLRVRFGALYFSWKGECSGFLNIISFHYVSVIAIVFRNCRCGHRNACVCLCVCVLK